MMVVCVMLPVFSFQIPSTVYSEPLEPCPFTLSAFEVLNPPVPIAATGEVLITPGISDPIPW